MPGAGRKEPRSRAPAPGTHAGCSDVTVVVPAYGPSPHLPRIVAALRDQTQPPVAIVVAHSGVGDPTDALARCDPTIRVVHRDARMIAAAARNRGLREVCSDWVAFLDSDVIPAPNWLAALRTAAAAAPRRFVAGSVGSAVSGGYWGQCLSAIEFSGVAPCLPDRAIQGGASANLMARTDDVRRAGGFDEAFAAGEDTVLAAALRTAGLENWFCAAARGDHVNIAGLGHCLRHLYWLGQWSGRVRRHVPLRGSAAARLWPLAPGLWLGKFALIVGRALRWGDGQRLRFFGLVPGILLGLLTWNVGFLHSLIAPPRAPAADPAEAAERPSISVIVCTFNRSALLERALLAFREQYPVAGTELVVVDNKSTDDTAAVVRRCAEALRSILPVRSVHEPVQGLSRARNAGIAAARGNVLAFLDDDAVPEPGWLAAIAEAFANDDGVAAIGGPIAAEFETPRPAWLRRDLEGYYSILDFGPASGNFPRGRTPFGANMALRRRALGGMRFSEHLGRVGTRLLCDEERELFARLQASGGRIAYAPAMRVRHFVGRERLRPDWLLRRSYAGGTSRVVAAGTPWARARLLARVAAGTALWRVKTAADQDSELVWSSRHAHYRGVIEAIGLPFEQRSIGEDE